MMSDKEKAAVVDRYKELFGNTTDVMHPSIVFDGRLYELLAKAVERGTRLRHEELEAVFGPLVWEGLRD